MPDLQIRDSNYRKHTTIGRKLNLTPEERMRRSETAKNNIKKRSGILTLKQKLFAKKYVENGGNATQAVIESYDANHDSAKTIGSVNLDKPAVINEIDRLLSQLGMNTDSWVASKLKQTIDEGVKGKASVKDALQGLNMILKINGSYPISRKMSMNINLKGKLTPENVSEAVKTVKKLSEKSLELAKDLTS